MIAISYASVPGMLINSRPYLKALNTVKKAHSNAANAAAIKAAKRARTDETAISTGESSSKSGKCFSQLSY